MPVTSSAPALVVGDQLKHKELIDDELWNRLVGRIVKDEDMERVLAERIMDQALAFLALCAKEPTGQFSPSPLVDIGWHTFILYTRAYASFCERLAGELIHHEPSDIEGVDYELGNIAHTVTALKMHGFTVDEMLWVTNELARCCKPNCHSE